MLYIEDDPRQHIIDLKTVHEQWVLLKQLLYGPADLEIRDRALPALIHIKTFSYGSIEGYTHAVMAHQNALKTTGAALPDWTLSFFFRKALQTPYSTHYPPNPRSA
ncbi:hypothetical protein N7G274_009169 [Stereocaulon virgatum]|uniref:Uncharacterized protein n=1 Tax=Stereocaulon virgatum TaxID=373712 RepID=A0ABR3ZZQ3_9LECA